MENQKTNYGWVCPVCGHVYAPYVPECTNCNSKLNANNNKWVLDQIWDTLRQCWNEINHDTCLGRNINQSRVFIKKLIEGEKITGHERFENYDRE